MNTADLSSLRPLSPREDVLVSVCFGDLSSEPATFDAIATLAGELESRYRFHEIIIIAEQRLQDQYLSLVNRIKNLRILTVRDGTAFYRKRVIAAEEAIGDVVLLTNGAELAGIDAIEMIERADDEQSAVLATRRTRIASRSFGAPLVLLGRIAGFKVDVHDLQTHALPRTLLNQLLAHPDPDLSLRFPPDDARIPLVVLDVDPTITIERDTGLRRRLLLLQKLLVYMAPRMLMAVTLTSALLAVLGFSFGLYVLGVWVVLEDVAPGWLTLSFSISLTAFFLGFSIMGLSLGLQQLISRTYRDSFDGVVSEITQVDLFGQVASDLNVDEERDHLNSQKSTAP